MTEPEKKNEPRKSIALDDYHSCKCGAKLWQRIDKDTVGILGANGQDYRIGFTHIELKCKNCGIRVTEHSELVEKLQEAHKTAEGGLGTYASVEVTPKPYKLPGVDKNKLLASLSEKQKEVYQAIENLDTVWPATEEQIAKNTGLPLEIVQGHIKRIEQEVEKIAPGYRQRWSYVSNQKKDVYRFLGKDCS